MTDDLKREAAIFNSAMQLAGDARSAFLDQTCGHDAALRRRVEELLVADQAQGFLQDAPLAQRSLDALIRPDSLLGVACLEKPGDRIGRYKLLQQIGEGGCAIVYMAEQEEPVRRRVALKIIKIGMDTKQVIARFEAERQALAMMDHPNIAKVLDAGATTTGRPFFAMELVRGTKITDYCDQNNLPARQRLTLFIEVCQALQHAHQKGIIHRDIKPSNILVTVTDGIPVPKVIDFGIAKATQGRLTDQTVFTAFEQFIGTPAYMSPEQAEITSLDIDTRSDIYSLGVLLYELLTGRTPFDQKELLSIGLDEMRRAIREREPLRPSTRLHTLLERELTTTARRRQLEPVKLIHLVRGDLDWIVMKCLEKDRARRYDTATALATEVHRYLADEPIVARPPSRVYRFQKLVRRNKLVFTAAGTAATALVLALGVSVLLLLKEKAAYRNAIIAENEAETETSKSKQSVELLRELLHKLKPTITEGQGTVKLNAALEGLLYQVQPDLLKKPELKQNLRSTIALVYLDFGEDQKAEQMARDALDILRSEVSKGRTRSAEPLRVLRDVLMDEHKFTEAHALFEGPLPREIGLQPQSIDLLRIRGDFWARTGNWKAAIADFSQLIRLEPENHEGYYSLAPLLVQIRDMTGYQRLCGEIHSHFGAITNDSSVAHRMGRVCLILPASSTDSIAAGWADLSLTLGENRINEPWCQFTKGLADYRRGDYRGAVTWTDRTQNQEIKPGQGRRCHLRAQACFLAAMAKHQLNQHDEARADLAAGLAIIQKEIEISVRSGLGRSEKGASVNIILGQTGAEPLGDLTDGWREWLIACTLLKEAKALIEPGVELSRNQ